MGYVSRQKYYIRCYTPSDDIIINNALEDTYTGVVMTLMKTIQLFSPLVTSSKFRFKFDLNAPDGGSGEGKIYRNGVAVGALQTVVGGAGYSTKSEDINTTNWQIGDHVDLYARETTGFGRRVQVKDFNICGVGNEFTNTYGM
jgi:hypothetical protein